MTTERVKDVFFDALDLPEAERWRFLDRACRGDAGLRAAVEDLLSAHDRAGAFMAEPTSGAPWSLLGAAAEDGGRSAGGLEPDEERPGAVIGRYRIIERIGEGGFGHVYLARQETPVARDVAMKIIKLGMDTREVVSRFELERQALAMMDHPGVARVYDAGATPSGRPYFVMEYVPGEPIIDWCDRRRLPIRERLRLFREVCGAVQHAHQKGIIHRDIKPSNVMVTEVDGRPTPKVIDFGVAKATEGDAAAHTMVTQARQVVGTPEYMSPEQASLTVRDVDTRTDVYSLGVLLYRLIVGASPFEQTRLRRVTPGELERIILDEVPPRPSARLAGLGPGLEAAARARGVDGARLLRLIRGELDWIAQRAMEKDRERRYQSVGALSRDISRRLNGEPVEAGPPSVRYRASKFVRRHRLEFGAAAAVLAALLTTVVISLVFAARATRAEAAARREAARAQTQLEKYVAISDLTREMILGVDPAVARGADTSLMESILESTVRRLDGDEALDPEVEASMRSTVAHAYNAIGDYGAGEAQARAALARAKESLGDRHEQTFRAENVLLESLWRLSRFDEAEAILVDQLPRLTEVYGPDHDETLAALNSYATVQGELGRLEEAVRQFEELSARRARAHGPGAPPTLTTKNNLAVALSRVGRHEESIALLEEILDAKTASLGEDHPETLATMNNLADGFADVGRADEAIALLEQALEIKRRVLEADHPSVVVSMVNLASALQQQARFGEAEALLEEALNIASRTLGPENVRTLTIRNNLAGVYGRLDRHAEALPHLEAVAARLAAALGEDHPNVCIVRGNLAGCYVSLERFEDALSMLPAVMERAEAAFGRENRRYAGMMWSLGRAQAGVGRLDEAADTLLEAHRLMTAAADPFGLASDIAESLAEVYERMGRPEDAAAWRAQGNAASPT